MKLNCKLVLTHKQFRKYCCKIDCQEFRKQLLMVTQEIASVAAGAEAVTM